MHDWTRTQTNSSITESRVVPTTTAQNERNTHTYGSISMPVRLVLPHPALSSNETRSLRNFFRSHLPLLLEHQTSIRLRNRNLPLHANKQVLLNRLINTLLRSHPLGRHHPRALPPLAPKHLHPPRHIEQQQQQQQKILLEQQKIIIQKQSSKIKTLPKRNQRRHSQTAKPKAKIPNHHPVVQNSQFAELYFASALQHPAMGGYVGLGHGERQCRVAVLG